MISQGAKDHFKCFLVYVKAVKVYVIRMRSHQASCIRYKMLTYTNARELALMHKL